MLLNNEKIEVSVLNDFTILTESEIKERLIQGRDGKEWNVWGIKGDKVNALIYITWLKQPILLGRLAKISSIRDNEMKRTLKLLKEKGEVLESSTFDVEIDNINAPGFSYSHNIGRPTTIKHIIFRHNGYYYTIICGMQDKDREEAEKDFNEFIKSIKLK